MLRGGQEGDGRWLCDSGCTRACSVGGGGTLSKEGYSQVLIGGGSSWSYVCALSFVFFLPANLRSPPLWRPVDSGQCVGYSCAPSSTTFFFRTLCLCRHCTEICRPAELGHERAVNEIPQS
eukprot:m.418950 g.418950  ORF g.418950 m.418950 type:complete len:121 (+) comp16836_c1_seq15:269-631(+)